MNLKPHAEVRIETCSPRCVISKHIISKISLPSSIHFFWFQLQEFTAESTDNPFVDIFLYSHHLSAWYSIDPGGFHLPPPPRPPLSLPVENPNYVSPVPFSQHLYHVLQSLAFVAMAIIIMRLKLFGTPALCVMASLLASRQVIQIYIR